MNAKKTIAEAKKLMFDMASNELDVKTTILLIHWRTLLTKKRIKQLISDAETLRIVTIHDGIFQKSKKKNKKNQALSDFIDTP